MKRVLEDIKTEKECEDAIKLLKKHKTTLKVRKRNEKIQSLIDKNPEFEKDLKSWRDIVVGAIGIFSVGGINCIVLRVTKDEFVEMSLVAMGRSYDFFVRKNGTHGPSHMDLPISDRIIEFGKFLIKEWF